MIRGMTVGSMFWKTGLELSSPVDMGRSFSSIDKEQRKSTGLTHEAGLGERGRMID